MNERDQLSPAMQSPGDSENSQEMLEGIDTFGTGKVKPVPESEREELRGVQGPGGDSRPDRTDPHDGGFIDMSNDPRMTTTRNSHDHPVLRKEDPKFLDEHRVDRDDEIVARPQGTAGQEVAELHPLNKGHHLEPEEL